MRAYQTWGEARKFLAVTGKQHHRNISLGPKFALYLDLRTTDDDRLHGSGRRIENALEGITLQIAKKLKPLALYIYTFI